MISLIQILKESTQKPKAIFLSGPAGAGKTTISKQIIPNTLETINSDDTYEAMLKASGIGMNQKNFTPDQLSQAAKMQSQAVKDTKEKYSTLSQEKKDIIIDGTGAASNPILKKKKQLEDLGYEVFMVMIYVSPLVSMERNKNRNRSLMTSIVLRTWDSVNKNIDIYRQEFGDNFVLINNNPKDYDKDFNLDTLKPYLSKTPMGKPKTPEEKAKSKQKFHQLTQDIMDSSSIKPEFDDLSTAKSKLNTFLK